jgi:hypothetical protein
MVWGDMGAETIEIARLLVPIIGYFFVCANTFR